MFNRLHVRAAGDLTQGCMSECARVTPFKSTAARGVSATENRNPLLQTHRVFPRIQICLQNDDHYQGVNQC